jgi:hypothetical protein
MRRFAVIIFFASFTAHALADTSAATVTIMSPLENALVCQRNEIKGTVSDPSDEVWLIIHPLQGGGYYVQPRISVSDSGDWLSLPYFGDPGPQHVGIVYEVRVIAGKETGLKEGQILSDWPKEKISSDVFRFVRQDC